MLVAIHLFNCILCTTIFSSILLEIPATTTAYYSYQCFMYVILAHWTIKFNFKINTCSSIFSLVKLQTMYACPLLSAPQFLKRAKYVWENWKEFVCDSVSMEMQFANLLAREMRQSLFSFKINEHVYSIHSCSFLFIQTTQTMPDKDRLKTTFSCSFAFSFM
jgi:hypothetical protein